MHHHTWLPPFHSFALKGGGAVFKATPHTYAVPSRWWQPKGWDTVLFLETLGRTLVGGDLPLPSLMGGAEHRPYSVFSRSRSCYIICADVRYSGDVTQQRLGWLALHCYSRRARTRGQVLVHGLDYKRRDHTTIFVQSATCCC